MNSALIKHVQSLVEIACKQESNAFGYDIWPHHIVHVVRYGKQLARLRGANEKVVELAALLHDYAAIKDRDMIENHHVHGAVEAEEILNQWNYPREKIEVVKQCILTHRGSLSLKRTSIEAQCLADADAMSHFDGVPSLLHYQFVLTGNTVDQGIEWLSAKLQRSWNKLSPDAQALAQPQFEACLKVLGQMIGVGRTD